MAEDDANDSGGGDATPAGKDRKKQIKNEHILIGVGIATIVVFVLISKKSSANAQSQQTGISQADLQTALQQQQLQDQEMYGNGMYGIEDGYNGLGYNPYSESSLYGEPDPELAALEQWISQNYPGNTTGTITPTPATTTTAPGTNSSVAGAGSGPSATNAASNVETYLGETWTELPTSMGQEEFLNEEGEYYYGTQFPNANAPYGTDVNGVPLTGTGAWDKQS